MALRSPMQVDDEFRKRMKRLQEQIMRKKGRFDSFPKITRDIIKMPEFELLERKLLGDFENNVSFGIKFDVRGR